MSGPPAEDRTTRLDDADVAELVLDHYDLGGGRRVRLINLSENATFLVEDPDTERVAILRVHRVAYHSRPEIESELAWISALRDETGVATPIVVPNRLGREVTTVVVGGQDRHAVLFHSVPGAEPDDATLGARSFETLGELTARMHLHARAWAPPPGFRRFSWDWESSLGGRPRWGRWQDGFGVGPQQEAVLGEAAELVHRRLSAYGTAPDRFGLVHADLRPANLLVEGDLVTVIDFDDCGLSWFMYDFGAAVSFIEHDRRLPEWQTAWLRGYRSVSELPVEHEEMLATFVMMRRLLLVAWLGSHAHARESQELGPAYTSGSVALARRYLASQGNSLL